MEASFFNNNQSLMTRKPIYLAIITALIITIMQLIISPYRSWNRSLSMSVGQIAEHDIISPLEFSVYKTDDTLQNERQKAAESVPAIYTLSDNITFNALRNLDIIIRHFESQDSISSWQEIMEKLEQKGYEISQRTVQFLIEDEHHTQVYEYLTEKLARILDIGIYPESYSESQITVKRKGKVNDYYLFKLYGYSEAREKLIDSYPGQEGKVAIADIVDNILVVNIILDQKATEVNQQKARMQVSLTAGKVLKNETIIRKGERVDSEHLQKLSSMHKALENIQREEEKSYWKLLSILGTLAILLILLIAFFRFLELEKGNIELGINHYYLLCSIFVLLSLIVLVMNNILGLSSLLIPMLFFIITVLQLFNKRIAFLYTMFQFFLVSMLLNWNYNNVMLLSISGLTALTFTERNRVNHRFFRLSVTLLVSFILLTIGLSLNQIISLENFFERITLGCLSILISVILSILLIPYIESRFKIVTKERLLDLLNLDNPLLKRLKNEAAGTYHHSLIVGNLAESAAEAIGANHLLARVGSYYHDIGKLSNPNVFVENSSRKSEEIHENMLPMQSAQIIKNHLMEGVKLAKQAKLPEIVIDMILQHHGTSKIKFFLNKAQENNIDFEMEEFKYLGPKPQTREAAILMIADIVEAKSRSVKKIDDQMLVNLLTETVNELIKTGQLFDSPLVLRDLKKVINAMLPILQGVYSDRIEYPKDEEQSNNNQ